MKSLMLLLTTCTCLVKCLPPPHPDVLAVRLEEEHLHPLLKSPALRNPHLQQVLPLSSLLHQGEKLVFARDTNSIPRKEIYKVLTHAGLIPRKIFPPSSEEGHKHNKNHIIFAEELGEKDFYSLPSYFPAQDTLQYL